MILIVTPTAEETEELRRTFAKLHCFVFCATYANMVRAAEKYKPNAILLKVPEQNDLLVKKMRKIRTFLPQIAVIALADSKEDIVGLYPDLKYSLRVQNRTLQYQALYFTHPVPHDAAFWGSYIIAGLLFVPTDRKVFLCGKRVQFSPEEVFLLRYLAEIYPRRADVGELGEVCFTYGKRTPRSTVASRISRINKKAASIISVPIISKNTDEGYGFDF